jgi:hypothetical protein
VTTWTGVEISQVSNNSKELPPRRYLRGGISKKYSAAIVKAGPLVSLILCSRPIARDRRQVPQATGKQAIDLQAAILAALRKRNGEAVIGEGAPVPGCLKDAVN